MSTNHKLGALISSTARYTCIHFQKVTPHKRSHSPVSGALQVLRDFLIAEDAVYAALGVLYLRQQTLDYILSLGNAASQHQAACCWCFVHKMNKAAYICLISQFHQLSCQAQPAMAAMVNWLGAQACTT
jgi:hypothetical protein